MMSLRSQVVFDACCFINAHASGRMTDLLGSLPRPSVLSKTVYDDELRTIREFDELSPVGSRFDDMVRRRLLQVVDFESIQEQSMFVNYTVELDDGEAATLAIARSRGYVVATDDKMATRYIRRLNGPVQIIDTMDLLHIWFEGSRVASSDLAVAFRNIRDIGRFAPAPNHPKYLWWQRILDGTLI